MEYACPKCLLEVSTEGEVPLFAHATAKLEAVTNALIALTEERDSVKGGWRMACVGSAKCPHVSAGQNASESFKAKLAASEAREAELLEAMRDILKNAPHEWHNMYGLECSFCGKKENIEDGESNYDTDPTERKHHDDCQIERVKKLIARHEGAEGEKG